MPSIFEQLSAKLAKKGVKNPFALSTDILQKNGYMKPGTRTLTAKGQAKEKGMPMMKKKMMKSDKGKAGM